MFEVGDRQSLVLPDRFPVNRDGDHPLLIVKGFEFLFVKKFPGKNSPEIPMSCRGKRVYETVGAMMKLLSSEVSQTHISEFRRMVLPSN
jgi:hypothetical protein